MASEKPFLANQTACRRASPGLKFKVSGFRSLHDTEFNLDPGLNVIVGPNGAGKTNVVSFLEFLSVFINDGIYNALAQAGGASHVFSLESLDRSDSTSVSVCVDVQGKVRLPKPKEGTYEAVISRGRIKYDFAAFEYSLKISLNKAKFDVIVDAEKISWRLLRGEKITKILTVSASAVDKSANMSTVQLNKSQIVRNMTFFSDDFVEKMIADAAEGHKRIPQTIEWQAHRGKSLFNISHSIARAELSYIESALSFDRSVNIVPNRVRQSEDIASTRQLEGDGSGALTALYKLRIERDEMPSIRAKMRRTSDYDRIMDTFFLLNESIADFEVSPNLRTGRLDSVAHIKSRDEIVRIPFSQLSDGTVKWLAVLTILRIRKSGYCVEEPENYVYPAAQRAFVEILRDSLEDEYDRFFIVTTHSETIVNAVRPEELLICSFDNGSTNLRRLIAAEKLREAINETGFGLGFFFSNEKL